MIMVNKQPIKSIQFSGGEWHVEVRGAQNHYYNEVLARIQSSNDLIQLLHTTEVITRIGGSIKLTIPYMPYARQDRVTEQNTAFTLKTFAKLINSINATQIITYDVHSDVTPALIDNLIVVPQWELVQKIVNVQPDVVIAPDAGAAKKAIKSAELLNCDFVQANKLRDVKTGQIKSSSIDMPQAKSAIIVDDICDGGRTFIELAKLVKPKVDKLYLYVTHGIFANGVELFHDFDRIFTTNSFVSDWLKHEKVTVLNLETL